MEQIILPIETENDVALVRQQIVVFAQDMGFDEFACAQISLGISEIVQNVIRYADSGKALVNRLVKDRVLRVEIIDKGKGFVNLQQAKIEGFSTAKSSLGLGLSVAKRAFDFMEIESVANEGSTIVLEKYLPLTEQVLSLGIVSEKDERYQVNGDETFYFEFEGDKIILGVIDGVGQGQPAHEIATLVKNTIQNNLRKTLEEIVLTCDAVLRESDKDGGATISIALISPNQLEYIGLGDTHAYIFNEESVKHLENKDGRLGEYILPQLKLKKYALTGSEAMVFCTDGINTRVADKMLNLNLHPRENAVLLFNDFHRLYGDATVMVVHCKAELL